MDATLISFTMAFHSASMVTECEIADVIMAAKDMIGQNSYPVQYVTVGDCSGSGGGGGGGASAAESLLPSTAVTTMSALFTHNIFSSLSHEN